MKRSKHNLSHRKTMSGNMGKLMPVSLVEVLPGDTFKASTTLFMRLSPMNTPVMHPCHVTIHHWFVPTRLLWENWESFITGGENGDDSSVYPTVTVPAETGFAEGSLADYLGIPPGSDAAGLEVSALPFRAYNLIYNKFYRDEQLISPVDISLADGSDSTTNLDLLDVAWEKDYFTSARPEPQLGPDVYLPLGTSAPVIRASEAPAWNVYTEDTDNLNTSASSMGPSGAGVLNTGGTGLSLDPDGGLLADLSEASAVTINALREASAFNRFYERMSRSGARYVEYLLGLGVKSSDARLQLPEYLAGGSETIQFSEVLQTAEGTDPVGTLRGHGLAAMRSNRYTRFFEEHGFVITLAFVKPVTMYTQGVNRMWSRRTKFDFWQRELQHIGQQEVLNQELYVADDSENEEVFGYQDRYDDYRRMPSSIAGEMRSTLDTWHMGRIFESRPALNGDFVTSNPTDRIFASSETDVLRIMAVNNLHARRLVAKRGTSYLK